MGTARPRDALRVFHECAQMRVSRGVFMEMAAVRVDVVRGRGFDDEAGIFKKIVMLDLKNTWRFPRGNAFRMRQADGDYFYFAAPLCHTRVKATWQAVRDPEQYEAFVLDPKTGSYSWRQATERTVSRTVIWLSAARRTSA